MTAMSIIPLVVQVIAVVCEFGLLCPLPACIEPSGPPKAEIPAKAAHRLGGFIRSAHVLFLKRDAAGENRRERHRHVRVKIEGIQKLCGAATGCLIFGHRSILVAPGQNG